jgi:hypothetical protein
VTQRVPGGGRATARRARLVVDTPPAPLRTGRVIAHGGRAAALPVDGCSSLMVEKVASFIMDGKQKLFYILSDFIFI